jgi:hypothetical protein
MGSVNGMFDGPSSCIRTGRCGVLAAACCLLVAYFLGVSSFFLGVSNGARSMHPIWQ